MKNKKKKVSQKKKAPKKKNPPEKEKSYHYKDLALVYFMKGISGVFALDKGLYTAYTAKKTLHYLGESGQNTAALENFFVSTLGAAAMIGCKRMGPQVGEEKRYKVQRPRTTTGHSRSLIQVPVDIFQLEKGDDVFIQFDADEIVIRKESQESQELPRKRRSRG